MQLYSVERRRQLEQYTRELRVSHDGIVTLALSSPDLIRYTFPVPDKKSHPFYHRYILEYYNTLSINNWIVIMESLLLEKSVIFYSNRFQRITSCILASLSLLYPLTWVHLIYPLLPSGCIDYASCPSPFVAGIHSCLVEKVKNLIGPDVRLVDLDSDTVYMTGTFGSRLPDAIRQWLVRGCNVSHQVILKQIRSPKRRTSTAAALLVEPYLELMTILLGGYRDAMQYTESTSVANHLTSSGGKHLWPPFDQPCPGRWHFNRDAFISSRGRECQAYLRELLQSQMVVQFFESRVGMLNSELSMIPPDDFEEAISRVSGPPRSSLLDLLGRGRAGFSRFARKLKKFKKTHSNEKQHQIGRTPMEISSPIHSRRVVDLPNGPDPTTSVQEVDPSSSESSSSSSPEPVPRDAFAKLNLNDRSPESSIIRSKQGVAVDQSSSEPSIPPFCCDESESTAQLRQSLTTSIFNAIPDIPADWLQPKSQWSNCTASTSASPRSVPGAQSLPNALSPIANPLFGTRKAESTKRDYPRIDLLHAFDPYCPDLPTVDPKPEADLATLLKELDPLCSGGSCVDWNEMLINSSSATTNDLLK